MKNIKIINYLKSQFKNLNKKLKIYKNKMKKSLYFMSNNKIKQHYKNCLWCKK